VRKILENNATVPLSPHLHNLAIFFAVIDGALSNTAI
jgi:hypothetical protein